MQKPRAGWELGTSESGKEDQCGRGIRSNGSVKREEAGVGRGPDPRALSTGVRESGIYSQHIINLTVSLSSAVSPGYSPASGMDPIRPSMA